MSTSIPPRPGSLDRQGSMREFIHDKTFSLEGPCPIRIEFEHLPAISKPTRRKSRERKVSRMFEKEEVTLPELRCENTKEENNFCAKENCENNAVSHGFYKFVKQSENQKVGAAGPSACRYSFDCRMRSLPEDQTKPAEEKLEESNALKRWEYWMKDKRRMQEYLSRRLNRSPWRLLLEDSDKIRKELEEKWLRTYTQIPEADKWRGHPYRWKAQLRLCNRKLRWTQRKSEAPAYCAVKTSLDNGEIPDMEFIGIPKTIQKEKGLTYQQNIVETQLDNLESEEARYIRKRRKKLKPHHIKMDDLEVIGKKILPKDETCETCISCPILPEIVVSGLTDEFEKEKHIHEPDSIFSLAIGGNVITYELGDTSQIPSKSYAWQVKFGVNTVGSLARSVLSVENRGMVAVRYRWGSTTSQPSWNLEKLQPKEYGPCFFFNKNSGFFLPGQICNLEFYLSSNFPGIRNETWYLETEPPLTQKNYSCTVTLSAIVTDEVCDQTYSLENYIDNRVKKCIVDCMVEIILRKALKPLYCVRDIEYRSIFSGKLQFECNNPKYYYNSTIVRELNKIYDEVTEQRRGEWDLSLATLCRMVNTHKESKEKNSILFEIGEKAKLLLKPTYVAVKETKKYRMAYGILCSMTNYMEEDYDYFFNAVAPRIIGMYGNEDYEGEEEMGESDYYNNPNKLQMRPVNVMFFKTMFYIKVYYRICHAVELIAGALETAKLFETWKRVNFKKVKPPPKIKEPPPITLQDFL